MNTTAVRQNVLEYLSKVASLPAEGLSSDDQDLIAEGILDSFGLLGLIAHLEQALKIRIEASDIDPAQFNTVTKIVQTVLKQLQDAPNSVAQTASDEQRATGEEK